MLKQKPILIILQRDNYLKDGDLLKSLDDSLKSYFESVIYFDPYSRHTSVFLDPLGKLNTLPVWIRKPYKACVLLKYPSKWSYFWLCLKNIFRKPEISIKRRCKKLQQLICKLKKEGREVVVLGRSSGGRVASLVADETQVNKIICLGYPFRNPEIGDEPERYIHLEHIKAPFLIFQGEHDVYGAREIFEKYKFSPSVKVEFVDTDHDFVISKDTLNKIVQRISTFLQQ